MEKSEAGIGKFVHRHLSQLKLLNRLIEHELDAAKGSKEISLDRHLVENMVDTLEIFVEDCEGASSRPGRSGSSSSGDSKPAVARLN